MCAPALSCDRSGLDGRAVWQYQFDGMTFRVTNFEGIMLSMRLAVEPS